MGLPRAERTDYEARCVDEANLLIVNFGTLCEGVSSRGGVYIWEHPRDPEQFPYPSIWDTGLVKGMEERTGAIRCLLDQCMYGGPTMKSTCLSGTADGLCWGARFCDRESSSTAVSPVGASAR